MIVRDLMMQRKRYFIYRLLPIVNISIITILLLPFLTLSPVDTPVSAQSPESVSYLSPQILRHAEKYADDRLSAGKLLVASEKIKDKNFAKTIVLLVRHSDKGAIGLIINRPTATRLHALLPTVRGLQNAPDKLYFGGPVSMSQITMVFQSSSKPEESMNVFDNIYISGSLPLLKQFSENRMPGQRFRLYAGYAGWAPGQLESEIARNDWKVLEGDANILFDKSPEEIWQRLSPQNMTI